MSEISFVVSAFLLSRRVWGERIPMNLLQLVFLVDGEVLNVSKFRSDIKRWVFLTGVKWTWELTKSSSCRIMLFSCLSCAILCEL